MLVHSLSNHRLKRGRPRRSSVCASVGQGMGVIEQKKKLSPIEQQIIEDAKILNALLLRTDPDSSEELFRSVLKLERKLSSILKSMDNTPSERSKTVPAVWKYERVRDDTTLASHSQTLAENLSSTRLTINYIKLCIPIMSYQICADQKRGC